MMKKALIVLIVTALAFGQGVKLTNGGGGGSAADTAAALAANPTDCADGTQFANAIAANGDLTCLAPSAIVGRSAAGTDAYAISPGGCVAAVHDQIVNLVPDVANTGAATLAYCGGVALAIVRAGSGAALANSELVAEVAARLQFDDDATDVWRLLDGRSSNVANTALVASLVASIATNSALYQTGVNCADGTATPADCGAASGGSVAIAAGATAVVVNTTAVTANSQIFLTFDSSLGTRLSVTCNTTAALPYVTARTAATSFTITVAVAPVTNPACFSYLVFN